MRLALVEKSLAFELQPENIWTLRDEFLKLNLAGTVPVLLEPRGAAEPADTGDDGNGGDDGVGSGADGYGEAGDPADREGPEGCTGDADRPLQAGTADAAGADVTGETGAPLVLVGSATIVEYLDEAYPEVPLLPGSLADRAEARRLQEWFDSKFQIEVSGPLIFEKVESRKLGLGAPNMEQVRRALENMHYHLEYIGYLIENRRWLAGDALSVGDLSAAAHLSLLDYLGDVPWHKYEAAKDWYVRIKSRPSFRPLLAERIAGMPPSRHYDDLDF